MTVDSTGLADDGRNEPDSLGYLSRRVRQEAEAAVLASTAESTLIHVLLATAYAKRFGEVSAQGASSAGQSWVDRHRLW